jgi:hypothetical protein
LTEYSFIAFYLLPVKAANLNFIWIDKRKQKGVFQIFAGRNIQRIEIRWNNMLPSRWLLPFHLPAVGSVTYSRVEFQSHAKN